VKEAIMEMKPNKALGLDGFLAKFYQKFLEEVKGDLMTMFAQLELPLLNQTLGL
jgi:hypothetical protein